MERFGAALAIYPGTFDPLTNGHVSLIDRALNIFGTVVVAVAADTPKKPMFTLDERVDMAKAALADYGSAIVVEAFHGLLIEYVRKRGAGVILRGMRAVADFEYEFQMALMNRRLARNIQTIFLMTDYRWLYIGSTIIKEVVRAGGDVRGLVPDNVSQCLRRACGFGK